MKSIKLEVDTVIGSDDPFDSIFIIPLLADWNIPKECVYNFTEECTEPITKIYILREPIIDGAGNEFKRIGACSKHHQYLLSIDNQKDKIENV